MADPSRLAKLTAKHYIVAMAIKSRRPADVIGNAVKVMKIAVGEDTDDAPPDDGKNKAAQELGSMGGKARAKAIGPRKRKQIAKKAAAARWSRQ
jgi:hypothetical protein